MYKITNYEISSKKIPPEFDGFKIAHISDTHSYPPSGLAENILAENPDICVITGDMLHDNNKPYDEFLDFARSLGRNLPIFAITGNHDESRSDLSAFFRSLRNSGVHVLDNKQAVLRRNGGEIAIFGINDPFSRIPKIIEKNIRSALSLMPDYDGYKILLFHRANQFDLIKDSGYDLILSGHMHGGQFRLGPLGGVLAPSSSLLSGSRMIFPKYCFGRYDWKNTVMLVNSGCGNTLPVPRFANPREIGLITLRHEK